MRWPWGCFLTKLLRHKIFTLRMAKGQGSRKKSWNVYKIRIQKRNLSLCSAIYLGFYWIIDFLNQQRNPPFGTPWWGGGAFSDKRYGLTLSMLEKESQPSWHFIRYMILRKPMCFSKLALWNLSVLTKVGHVLCQRELFFSRSLFSAVRTFHARRTSIISLGFSFVFFPEKV